MNSRLPSLKPRIGSLPNRIGPNYSTEAERSRYRDKTEPWRAWYKLERWRKLRIQQFIDDHFTCRICGKLEGDTRKLVCHHVEQHHGSWQKFWKGPFATLCKTPCHDSIMQSRERQGEGRSL